MNVLRNKSRLLIAIGLWAIALVSCNESELDDIPADNDGPRFSSSILGFSSKVDNDLWDLGDTIGINMVYHGFANSNIVDGVKMQNLMYYAADGGIQTSEFLPVNNPFVYATEAYDFQAYYPYTPTLASNNMLISVTDQANQDSLDFMFAFTNNGGAGYTKDFSGTIDLPFTHSLVKLIFNLTAGNGLSASDLENTVLSFNDVTVSGIFEMYSRSFSVLSPSVGVIMLQRASNTTPGYDATFEGIFIPQEVSRNEVNFDIHGDGTNVSTYKLDENITALVAGQRYSFDIVVSSALSDAQRAANAVCSKVEVTNWDDKIITTKPN